jgi:hypothetical protein
VHLRNRNRKGIKDLFFVTLSFLRALCDKNSPQEIGLSNRNQTMIANGKIRAFLGAMTEHHRYRSWDHCYGYFHRATATPQEIIAADRHHAALQLGFYLASWGMYRGSSFLLQYDYSIHLGVIGALAAPQFEPLWKAEFGSGNGDEALVPVIFKAVDAIREAYRPFAPPSESRQASDTLVKKVLLGTFGCLPACDTYLIAGFKAAGLRYSYLNGNFVERVLRFCRDNLPVLRGEQTRIKTASGMHYPLMKLVDMHFWQTGGTLRAKGRTMKSGRKVL